MQNVHNLRNGVCSNCGGQCELVPRRLSNMKTVRRERLLKAQMRATALRSLRQAHSI